MVRNQWIAIDNEDAGNDDEPEVHWYYFQNNGKAYRKKGSTSVFKKTINGKKYGFDKYGRMIADWYTNEEYSSKSDGDATDSSGSKVQGQEPYTETFMYFSTPEDGARYTKGWFKVVPGYYLHEAKYEDGDNYWYYADGKGHIVASEIKTIKSKKYAFDGFGRMKKGLQLIKFEAEGTGFSTKQIASVIADDDGTYPYDTEDNFDDTAKALKGDDTHGLVAGEYAFMYFSNDEDHDGSMKTGKQNINIDGDNFTFRFYSSGSRKGQGITGVDDKKMYLGGKLIAADSDEKVNFYEIKSGEKITVAKLISSGVLVEDTSYDKKDETKYVLADNSAAGQKDFAEKYVAINTSGAVLTSGTKKDGDDYKISLKKYSGGKVDVMGDKLQTAYIEKVILK